MNYLLYTLVFVFSFWSEVFAIRCVEGDFDPMLCELPILAGTRCQDVEWFRIYCNKATEGCKDVKNGCIGMTPPGHWYPLVENGYPRWRCRCGCFGEETYFLTEKGKFYGYELVENISNFRDSIARLMSLDEIESTYFSERAFNSLMFSRQKEAIMIATVGKREIILSHSHPVLIADIDHKLTSMKRAQDVRVGDFLMDSGGIPDRVTNSGPIKYGKRMVNFNIMSENAVHHIVPANDLLMGDLGWQETLNSFGSRILYRTEILKFLNKKKEGGVLQ